MILSGGNQPLAFRRVAFRFGRNILTALVRPLGHPLPPYGRERLAG